ncbi:MAG: hypothetical protein MUO31_04835 [Thermodesulfovibrionales bacterium]|nr:hypothetical protein [Thermodesulfovibrionales bacterium]
MEKKLILLLVPILLICLVSSVHASDVRKDAMCQRMAGFQYPLDSGGGYYVGWVSNFDLALIESDFAKIHSWFPHFNLLRIPMDYFDMKWAFMPGRIQAIIDLADEYGFKLFIVLFNRLGGSIGYLTPEKYLPSYWAEQEADLANIVSPFANEETIYAWALENEANVFQMVTLGWFAHFIPYIKSLDSNHPISTSFYGLGPNSSTIFRSHDLINMGLDFVEWHYYPTESEDIQRECSEITSYVNAPIFLSEFGTYNGLSTYNRTTNDRILGDVVTEYEARLNVIGVAYYRWSNDLDPWTIWNYTSQSPKLEGAWLNAYAPGFLSDQPYAYLEKIVAINFETAIVNDPSFEKKAVWPDYSGWVSWSNNTVYDHTNVTTSSRVTHDPVSITISDNGFEENSSIGYWTFDSGGGSGSYYIMSNTSFIGSRCLDMYTASPTDDHLQMQHEAMSVVPRSAYILDGWIYAKDVRGGGYGFIEIAFRGGSGSWLSWHDSPYINLNSSGWVHVYAVGICDPNAVDIQVNCRVRANGGSAIVYFDELNLIRIDPMAYDGLSNMVAYAQGLNEAWGAVQISQNYTFTNPTEDIKKIWTFSCQLANVQSPEYWTDWKGVYVQLAFTTDDPDEWISWSDGQHISFTYGWINLNVSAIPPSNAKGLRMIIKVAHSEYGVFFVDQARLSACFSVAPTDFLYHGRRNLRDAYDIDLTIQANVNTNFTGLVYPGYGMEITGSNVEFNQTAFWSLFNQTSMVITLHFGEGAIDIWMPIMLILGLLGLILVVILPAFVVYEIRKKKYGFIVTGFFIWMIAICLVIGWLWG